MSREAIGEQRHRRREKAVVAKMNGWWEERLTPDERERWMGVT